MQQHTNNTTQQAYGRQNFLHTSIPCVMAKCLRNIFNSAGFVHYMWHWVWCVPVVALSAVCPSWHWVRCPCRGTGCGVSLSWHWVWCPCRGTECGVSLSWHWMWCVPVVALDAVCPCRGIGFGVSLSWNIRQINQPFQQRY
jgi:hypothetical protein